MRFHIRDWLSKQLELSAAEIQNLSACSKRRHNYSVDMKIYVYCSSKLKEMRDLPEGSLSEAQKVALEILIDMDMYRIESGGHVHHIHPVKEDGHPSDKANLIRLSAVHHFLFHLALAVLFHERSLHTTVKWMATGQGILGWDMATCEEALLTAGTPNSMVEQVGEVIRLAEEKMKAHHMANWEERFEELVEYKTRFGNCRVPRRYSTNAKLGQWVMNQRAQYKLSREGKSCVMTEERIQELESVGFEWSVYKLL